MRKRSIVPLTALFLAAAIAVLSSCARSGAPPYITEETAASPPVSDEKEAALTSSVFSKDSMGKIFTITYKENQLNIPYRLHVPKNAGAKNSYPLVLHLHGSGEIGSDNTLHVSKYIKMLDTLTESYYETKPCIILAPQFPDEQTAYSQEAQAGIMRLVEQIQEEYNADKNRLYVTGFSMGGDLIWSLLMSYPSKFAAAAPISGNAEPYIPRAAEIKDTAIWIFHGEWDIYYSVKTARKMTDALKSAGGKVDFTEYKMGSHMVADTTYANPALIEWFFAQSR